MHFNFCAIHILWIFHICGFCILNLQMLAIVSCISIVVLIFADEAFEDDC